MMTIQHHVIDLDAEFKTNNSISKYCIYVHHLLAKHSKEYSLQLELNSSSQPSCDTTS